MPVLTNLVGPIYEAESKVQLFRRLINWYPEENLPGNEYPWVWNPTPGTKTWKDTSENEVRMLYEKGDLLYAVAGCCFYSIDKNKTITQLGMLDTNQGYVDVAEGADELLMVDGSNGYSYQITNNDFARITDADFPSRTESITFQSGYFVAATPDAKTFYISNADDGRTWDGLDFGSKSVYSDNLVAVQSFRSYLWLFGKKTTEIHAIDINAGTNFPFLLQQGTTMDIGCAAPKSVVNAGDTFFWIARHADGGYVVCQAEGFAPKVVSNRSISIELNKMETIEDCIAWSYTQHSHEFVMFNFPTAKRTYVYDLTTGQWHQRTYRTAAGKEEHHIGQSYAFFDNTHLVASRINGKILELGLTIYTDNDGDTIRRVGTAGPLEADTRRLTMHNLHIQTETGVGDGATSSQGIDPQLMLRVSKDFGNTWSNVVFKSPGKQGEYRDRVLWSRVGTGRSITLEMTATDPVKWVIKGARADISVGNS